MMLSDKYCPSCRNAKDHKSQDNEVCWSCVAMGGLGNYKQKKTNADRLSSDMEYLAQFLADLSGGDCPPDSPECEYCRLSGEPWKCWLDWLRQEASDG